METEEWRDIPGYEGLYQASNMGRVKSLSKKVKVNRWGKWTHRITKEKILNTTTYNTGYAYAALGRGTENRFTVHELVALCFLGPRKGRCVVHHKDENKLNNKVENLEYKSYRNHTLHHLKQGKLPIGVSQNGLRFRVRVCVNNKRITIGRFDTPEEAGKEYQQFIKNGN